MGVITGWQWSFHSEVIWNNNHYRLLDFGQLCNVLDSVAYPGLLMNKYVLNFLIWDFLVMVVKL